MSKSILLADDSVTIQKVVSITFTGEDFDLSTVNDGMSAISKAREIKPDLILLDISMPQKNGYEVCDEIKQDPELQDIPILLLAGTFEPYNEDEGKKVGADDYIVKPFESQDLIDKVNALLNKQDILQPAEDKVVSEKKDVWDVTDIGDFLSVEDEAVTPSEEGVGEAVGMSFANSDEFAQPGDKEGVEAVSEETHPEEGEIIAAEDGVEEVVEFPSVGDEAEEFSEPLEEERIEDIPGEKKEERVEEEDIGVGEEDLEFIEDVESLEDIEPLNVEEGLSEEEVSAEDVGEESAYEDTKEESFFDESAEVGEADKEVSEETIGEEFEFEEVVSEDAVNIEEEVKEEAEKFVSDTPLSEEVTGDDTMLKNEISEEIGSEDVTEKMEERAPDFSMEEIADETEDGVYDEDLDKEAENEHLNIEEVLEEEIKQKIDDNLTRERIEDVLSKVVKEVVEEVTWEVAPGLIEDIIRTEVKRIKGAIAKFKDALNSES